MNPALNIEKSAVHLAFKIEEEEAGFHVVRARAQCGLSTPFRVELTLKHANAELDPLSLIGRNASVTLLSESPRPSFTGMVESASLRERHVENDGGTYELVLVPRTHWMQLRRDHRLFLDMKATDIAMEIALSLASRVGNVLVYDEAGLPEHEYRTQYGETDFDAMTRLLAEDGVTFVYDLFKASELLLIPDMTQYSGGERSLPYVAAGRLQAGSDAVVTSTRLVAHEAAGRATVKDVWMERPDFDASSSVNLGKNEDLDLYRFEPGVGGSPAELENQATLRLLEEFTPSRRVLVTSSSFVAPGQTLRIADAPLAPALLPLQVVSVTSVWTSGPDAEQRHELVCIPAAKRWVPPRSARPVVGGIQKAVVVGDGEIDCDEYGRVLCQFDWDRDKQVTRRVEVAQAWAGPGYGLFTQPRVGDQVLVSYLDGDPDEPVIVGRVHNGKNRHPVALPAEKAVSAWRTKSTPNSDGYNEIRMDDTAGAELFSMHAQLDLESVIERDGRGRCGRDFSFEVARHTSVKVNGLTDMRCAQPASWSGTDLSIDCDGNAKTSVAGSYTLEASRTMVATKGDQEHVAGGVFRVDAPHIFLNAGGTHISIKPGQIELSCGGSVIRIAPDGITQIAPLIELNP